MGMSVLWDGAYNSCNDRTHKGPERIFLFHHLQTGKKPAEKLKELVLPSSTQVESSLGSWSTIPHTACKAALSFGTGCKSEEQLPSEEGRGHDSVGKRGKHRKSFLPKKVSHFLAEIF